MKDIKKLQDKERAFAIYNPSDEEQTVRLNFSTIDLGGLVELHDCFTGAHAATDGIVAFTVPAHGTKILRAKGQKRLDRKVYEAETAYLPAYQELRNNQAEKSGIFTADATCSGGYKAGWLGGRADNDIQWNDVYVQKAGVRRLTITYFCGEDRDMDLEVNGQRLTRLETHSRDWSQPAVIGLDVYLRKGRNTIRLSNAENWMPDIDKITLE